MIPAFLDWEEVWPDLEEVWPRDAPIIVTRTLPGFYPHLAEITTGIPQNTEELERTVRGLLLRLGKYAKVAALLSLGVIAVAPENWEAAADAFSDTDALVKMQGNYVCNVYVQFSADETSVTTGVAVFSMHALCP